MTLIKDVSAAKEYIRRLKTEPVFFVRELWRDRKLDSKAPLSDIELDMVAFGLGGPPLRGVLGPRGVGKTSLITAPLSCFRGLRDPDRKIIILSKSATEAKKTIAQIREWLDCVWFLEHLAPQRGQFDNATYFDFGPAARGQSRQPSVSAFGNDGQLEGNRAHTIIPDDMETKSNTKTQEGRDELHRIFNETINIRFPDRPYAEGGPIDPTEVCAVGTFKHEDSLYKRIDRMVDKTSGRKIFEIRTYPLAAPERSDHFLNLAPIVQRKLDNGELRYTVDGHYQLNPLFPARFTSGDISVKMSTGRHEFAMEHMLLSDLSESQRYPLKLADLIVMDVPKKTAPISVTWGRQDNSGSTARTDIMNFGLPGDRLYRPFAIDAITGPYQGTKAVIDPAGKGSDLTGLSIISMLNGLFWLKYCRGLPGGAEQHKLGALALLLREHDVRDAYVENNIDTFGFYVSMLEIEIRKLACQPGENTDFPLGWSCTVTPFRVGTMKEERVIATLAPILGSHRLIADPTTLIVPPGEDEANGLQFQLSRIQAVRKCLKEDACIDSLASCLDRWQEHGGAARVDPVRVRESAVDRLVADAKRRDRMLRGQAVDEPSFFQRR